MLKWIDTKCRLPRLADADCAGYVWADDGNGPYLTQWYNVDRSYHRCWAKLDASPITSTPKMQL